MSKEQTKTDKSYWSVLYKKEFPIITLTDYLGTKQIIDVNEIVLKERGRCSIEALQIIKNLIKDKK
jgi:hypothetical protein